MCEIDWSAIAAWVQAIFSVAAIYYAVQIGKKNSEESRQLVIDERKRQADIVASQITYKIRDFLHEIKMRSDDIEPAMAQVGKGEKLLKESLKIKFIPFDVSWMTERRQYLLLFDRDTGIKVQSFFESVESCIDTIEMFILAYGVGDKAPEDGRSALRVIASQFRTMQDKGTAVVERLEKMHQL